MAKEIPNSEGTILYLRVINNVLRAFLDITLKPLERVRKIWFSLFLIRIWKANVIETRAKSNESFIGPNCYACIEINAHSLILIMLYLKEKILDYLFCVELFSSQPCENIFRIIRSMSTTYSTITNFSLSEILEKMSRIEFANKIVHIKFKESKGFHFPRVGTHNCSLSSFYSKLDREGNNCKKIVTKLPSKQEIFSEIELSKLEAIEYAASLGVIVREQTLKHY